MATDSSIHKSVGSRLAVISPHFDDAVFSCGETIAAHPGCTVITVFGGAPAEAEQRITDWDRHCGFANAAEAMAARRREDADALALLNARPLFLDFNDSQYAATPAMQQVAAALISALDEVRPTLVLYPLGLFHSDHKLVNQASSEALADSSLPALVYEDALYRALPGLLQQRLAELARSGWEATPVAQPRRPSGHLANGATELATLKQQAIQAYASQLRAFGNAGYADTAEPERCWRLEPRVGEGRAEPIGGVDR